MIRAIFASAFDPFANFQLDIIERTVQIFDHLIVAVEDRPGVRTFIEIKERVRLIKEIVGPVRNVEVDAFGGPLIEYASKKNARVVVRGVPTVLEFEEDVKSALTERKLFAGIGTVFIVPSKDFAYVGPRFIADARALGKDISSFVPSVIAKVLEARSREPKA